MNLYRQSFFFRIFKLKLQVFDDDQLKLCKTFIMMIWKLSRTFFCLLEYFELIKQKIFFLNLQR